MKKVKEIINGIKKNKKEIIVGCLSGLIAIVGICAGVIGAIFWLKLPTPFPMIMGVALAIIGSRIFEALTDGWVKGY